MTRTGGWQPRRGRDDDDGMPRGNGPGRGAALGGVAVVLGVIAVVAGVALFNSIKYANEGTVQVVTQWGRIVQVYKPDDGWFTTIAPGKDSHVVTIRSFTEKAPVRVTSRDNAALKVDISVTAYTDPDKVAEYVRKYGFGEDERHRRRGEILQGLVQTEARNAFAEHAAYDVYASQEKIQQSIIEGLRPQLMNQLHLVTESVQIGNPDFLDDRIEAAASGVVANEKQKQAE
ncbi:MAG TPA: SPFH domain-containing protein, partial [Tepidisphaeraceae bacterium]|nr:SPFH domain-containing protein [Tepidisphaeraceae bacterium]